MAQQERENSIQAIQDIRNIMERSARVLSLSGWSGIWAGCTALASAWIAHGWIAAADQKYRDLKEYMPSKASYYPGSADTRFLLLALITFAVALAGALFFTIRKIRKQGGTFWNKTSRQLIIQLGIPLLAGGIFCFCFLYNGHLQYIGPGCLIFYGLAVINGSKYTLGDIRYLGLLEIMLGCINLLLPDYNLYFWAAGFGLLHILYGIMMWNRYNKQIA